MKEDVYGPLLQATLRSSDRPLSASELREATVADTGESPSIQRVYAWLKANRGNLREMGRTTKGGTTYVWRDTEMGRAARSTVSVMNDDAKDSLEVGSVLKVSAIRITGGQVVVELTDEHGGIHAWRP